MKQIAYLNAKLDVMDSNYNKILCKPLNQMPLAEKHYSIEGEKRIGYKAPCILERRFIENSVCIESAERLKSGQKYHRSEVEWLFDLYGLSGEYVIINY